jgi:hypothetical protein
VQPTAKVHGVHELRVHHAVAVLEDFQLFLAHHQLTFELAVDDSASNGGGVTSGGGGGGSGGGRVLGGATIALNRFRSLTQVSPPARST